MYPKLANSLQYKVKRLVLAIKGKTTLKIPSNNFMKAKKFFSFQIRSLLFHLRFIVLNKILAFSDSQ